MIGDHPIAAAALIAAATLVAVACAPAGPAPMSTGVAESPTPTVVGGASPPADSSSRASAPPRTAAGVAADFVRVSDVVADALYEIRYAGEHNFLGRPVAGYESSQCWLTSDAAAALRRVRDRVARDGLRLKIYDCFRPQRAVDDFVKWADNPHDTKTKAEFYPGVDKSDLFPRGYIAERSGHSRGSTVDLTLVRIGSGTSPPWNVGDSQEACTLPARQRFPDTSLDMGTGYDCFDPLANTANSHITPQQADNRAYLVSAMAASGFTNLPEEWWHFTLTDEPHPDTYYDAELTAGPLPRNTPGTGS